MKKTEKDYSKEFKEFQKKFEELKKSGLVDKEAEFVERWLDKFDKKINAACMECLNDVPSDFKGVGAMFFSGLARYTCRLIYKMEKEGMFNEELGGFEFYKNALLPMCYKLVEQEEIEKEDKEAEETVHQITEDMLSGVSIDEILTKYFSGQENEFSAIRKKLEEMRLFAMKGSKDVN